MLDDHTSVFLFGTLRDDELAEIVFGRTVKGDKAVLRNETAFDVSGGAWPVLRPSRDFAEGVLVNLPSSVLERADYYEGLFSYVRVPGAVELQDGELTTVDIWRPLEPEEQETCDHRGSVWNLEAWQSFHGALARTAAKEVMELMNQRPPGETARRWPMISARAQARLNAEAATAPSTLRHAPVEGDIAVEAKRTPYAFFFAVEEYDLRHRRFDGGQSDLLTRAAFISADAVTVVPYDPSRDRVLLIEQFRPGPMARGDQNPWSLEAIAGRIDGGESPETAALREAEEEAGLTLKDLIRIVGYYPSPGAKAEYLHSYVGLADLPDSAAGLGGLADENEDIRSHVLPLDAAVELVYSGEINNAPLILSLFELVRLRPSLRS